MGRRGSGRLGARLAALAAAATVAVVAGAPAAWAVGTAPVADGSIDALTPQPNGRLAVVFSGIGLPSGATIDPASVTVRIDGQPVPSTAKPISNVDSAPVRSTMLVLDTSDSMKDPTAGGVSRIDAGEGRRRLLPELACRPTSSSAC